MGISLRNLGTAWLEQFEILLPLANFKNGRKILWDNFVNTYPSALEHGASPYYFVFNLSVTKFPLDWMSCTRVEHWKGRGSGIARRNVGTAWLEQFEILLPHANFKNGHKILWDNFVNTYPSALEHVAPS